MCTIEERERKRGFARNSRCPDESSSLSFSLSLSPSLSLSLLPSSLSLSLPLSPSSPFLPPSSPTFLSSPAIPSSLIHFHLAPSIALYFSLSYASSTTTPPIISIRRPSLPLSLSLSHPSRLILPLLLLYHLFPLPWQIVYRSSMLCSTIISRMPSWASRSHNLSSSNPSPQSIISPPSLVCQTPKTVVCGSRCSR